jgi:KDO2-lipid IV(A) lauroyltransferase
MYSAGSVVARLLHRPVAEGAATAFGAGAARALPSRRQMVERHLRRIYGPQLLGRALDRKVRASFASYARYWVESFRLPTLTAAQIDGGMSWEGVGHLEDGLAKGNGVIFAIPHLGGWDWGGAWLATVGYPVTVVVEALDPPELFEWFAGYRRSLGMEVVSLGPDAGTAVLRALRNNHSVCLLSDRNVGAAGVEVEFFGERLELPGGPVTLAMRTGAAVVPAAVYFDGARHRGVMRPPVPMERTGRLRDDVVRATQLLAYELEALIRHAPEQWHLMQPNWPSDFEVAKSAGSVR